MFKKLLSIVCILFTIPFITTCKEASKAVDVVTSILCGRGEHKSKVSAGFDLSIIKDFFNLQGEDATVSDGDIQDYLNQALDTLGVSSSAFNIQNVESVEEGDSVRFMQLGGSIGEAFGAASGFLSETFSKSDSNPFEFVSESFGVKAAAANEVYRYQKVNEFFKAYLPLLADDQVLEPNSQQWAFSQIEDLAKVKELYAKMLVKAGVDTATNPIKVAVLDTGVDLEHPALANESSPLLDAFARNENGDILGYDAIGEETGVQDVNGHGTHCAGIIAGRKADPDDEKPLGIATLANAKIMPIKVLGDNGSGGFQAIEKGVRWAMHNGAKVLSMSLGAGLEFDDVKKNGLRNRIFDDAIEQGIIIIVAAGNENCPLGGECANSGGLFQKKFSEYTVLPCAYNDTICIGATNAEEELAVYSNYSSQKDTSETGYRTQPDVNAPGTAIYSTWPTAVGDQSGYKIISGTSMATPFVAGVAALIKTVVPNITQAQMNEILTTSIAKPEDMLSKSGTGRLDVHAALANAAKNYLQMSDEEIDFDNEIPVRKVPDAPKQESSGGGSTVEAISSLWGSVCG